jgi:hypothetical protein
MHSGFVMPNRAIEIHDSAIDRISTSAGDAVIHFASVYIHQSAGRPGIDAGTGWIKNARLKIVSAAVEGSFSSTPRKLTDGHIKIDGTVFKNEIPIPLRHAGDVGLRLESWSEVVVIRGGSAEFDLVGEPECIEEFYPNQED